MTFLNVVTASGFNFNSSQIRKCLIDPLVRKLLKFNSQVIRYVKKTTTKGLTVTTSLTCDLLGAYASGYLWVAQ
jgi:hypothetical protein